MKRELRDKWCAALRSGKYKQTKESLRDKDGYCCLGVLLDVYDPNGWMDPNEWMDHNNLNRHVNSVSGEDEWNDEAFLSMKFVKKIKLLSHDDIDYQETLATMNDDGRSFSEIAEWIEANVISDDDDTARGPKRDD